MSDEQYLIDLAWEVIEGNMKPTLILAQAEGEALLRRIRELESANYRLTEERDRLKGWADKYHDEVLELRSLKPKASE